jgi:nitric oxide dioxygenase
MLSPQTIAIVKATAPVVTEHAEAITRRFYMLMFAGNPEVQAYFNSAHQHSGGQQRALAGAICAYAANIDNLTALGLAVELIAQKHCSLGIQADHYPVVGKHLLAAIKDVLGAAATDDVVAAWAEAYGVLADIFIGREQQIYDAQRALPGGWNGYRRFVVQRKRAENGIITSFYLVPEDGGRLPDYIPGQYITVKINHPQMPTSLRNYSLSDRPGTGYFRISVKRETGPSADSPAGVVSNFLHDAIQAGDVLDVGPPCGEFTLSPAKVSDRPLVLMSGGIGITPLLAMLKTLAHRHWAVPVYFIYAARNSRVQAFAHEVRDVVAARPNIHAHVRFDAPLADDVSRQCCDSVGVVDLDFLRKQLPNNDAEFYFCGPKAFMAAVHHGLKEWGVPESQIHFEFFGPKQDVTSETVTHRKPSQRALQAVLS